MVMAKKLSYSKIFDNYLKNKLKLQTYQKIGIALLVFVIAGIFGWLYEFVFTFVNEGGEKWYMQGGNLLPWINIYAFGALFVILITYKIKRYPWAVFLLSVIVTGTLELVAGWLVYTIGNGTRYWDYNNQPWNIGNIGGFVCLLSVTAFGISSLLLMYIVLPFCIYLSQKMSKRSFLTLAITLFSIIMIDELTNLTLKNLSLPTAMDFYRSIGWEYK
jgi:uncharacterized membrane protein